MAVHGNSSGGGNGSVFRLNSTTFIASAITPLPEPIGDFPVPLAQAPNSDLYGIASAGGANGLGFIFRVTLSGTYSEIVHFNGTQNGALPKAGLTLGSDGALYGTTSAGGASGRGTVFRLAPDGSLTTLASFAGANGSKPIGGVIEGSDGAFYGTTTTDTVTGRGTLYRITPAGTLTTLAVLGRTPLSSGRGRLVREGVPATGDEGVIGVTAAGGANGFGSVFRLGSGGSSATLASFAGTDGSGPNGGLLRAADGALYGTARAGGAAGKGTVFRVTAAGVIEVLAQFTGANGATPAAGLALGADGNFYGATEAGGANALGSVFRITTAGGLTTLGSFAGADGSGPLGGLAPGGDGALYGMTRAGGAGGFGTVYRITAAGAVETVASLPDAAPVGGLALGLDGKLYGLSGAGVYRVSTGGAVENVAALASANGALTRDAAGNFYGATATKVFKVTPAGVVTTALDFNLRPGRRDATGPAGLRRGWESLRSQHGGDLPADFSRPAGRRE